MKRLIFVVSLFFTFTCASAAIGQDRSAASTPALISSADALFDREHNLTGLADDLLKPSGLKWAKSSSGTLRIEVHSNARGSSAYNKKATTKRARVLAEYFVALGLDAERVEAVGMGEEYPIATNSTAAGRSQNARVVLTWSD